MPHVYKQGDRYQLPFDPKRCKASVFGEIQSNQCRRRSKEDGWCGQHHPDAIEARDLERARKEDEKDERRTRVVVNHGLRAATVEQLREELTRRKKV